MIRKLGLLLMFLVLFGPSDVFSQKVAGAEIYYKLIGAKTYLITAHVYRECNLAPLNQLDGYVIADTFRLPMAFRRVSIQKINDTCDNPCNNQNAISNKGFERHTFTDTVDFTSFKYKIIPDHQLCQVYFAIHQRLRDTTVTTYTYGNGMMYIDALVNICQGFQKVRSPEFSFEPKFVNGCNQPFMYSPGPIDTTDFDSMSFDLVTPMLDKTTPVTYTGSYTKDVPMTPYCPPNPGMIRCRSLPGAKPSRGFYFDNQTCLIVVTPTKCDEVATIKFRISEWRKDSLNVPRLIGYVCREMTVFIRQLKDNDLPVFTGNNIYTLCNNAKLCFSNGTEDEPFLPKQTAFDTVYMDWNHGIPDASFKLKDSSAREKESEFCWTPSQGTKSGTRLFGVMAYDKKCNSSLVSRSYLIGHNEPVKFNTSYYVNGCNQVVLRIISDSNYSLSSTSISVLDQKGQGLFSTGKTMDSFTVNRNGTFYIRYTVSGISGSGCQLSKYDTFHIQEALSKGFEYITIDTFVCQSYPASLSFNPSNISQIRSWAWYLNGNLLNTADSVIHKDIYDTSLYMLRIADLRGCTSESSRRFVPYKNGTRLFPSNALYTCSGSPYEVKYNAAGLKSPLNYSWIGPGNDSSNASSYTFIPKYHDIIRLSVKDDNHCLVTDSAVIWFYPQYNFELTTGKTIVCTDSVVSVKVAKFTGLAKSTDWKINGLDTALNLKYEFSRTYNADTRITLSIHDENGCIIADTLDIKPLHNIVELSDPAPICEDEVLLLMPDKLKPYIANRNFEWRLNGLLLPVTDSFMLWSDLFDGAKFTLRVSIGGSCPAFDSATVTVNPLPVFKIVSDTLFSPSNRVQMMTDKSFKSYYWSNFRSTSINSFWAYELGPAGLYKIWCRVTDFNNCSSTDTITIDTRKVGLELLQSGVLKAYPNPFSSEIYIDAKAESLIDIYASDGRLVDSLLLKPGLQVWSTSQLSPGIYLLRTGYTSLTLIKE